MNYSGYRTRDWQPSTGVMSACSGLGVVLSLVGIGLFVSIYFVTHGWGGGGRVVPSAS